MLLMICNLLYATYYATYYMPYYMQLIICYLLYATYYMLLVMWLANLKTKVVQRPSCSKTPN